MKSTLFCSASGAIWSATPEEALPGEDLVPLADQVATGCDGLGRIGAVVDDRQLDRTPVHSHRALGRVGEPVAGPGCTRRRRLRAAPCASRRSRPCTQPRRRPACPCVASPRWRSREECRERRECRDATPVPCLRNPDLRENREGLKPETRFRCKLGTARRIVAEISYPAVRLAARAAAAPCRAARSRAGPRSPRSSAASPPARAPQPLAGLGATPPVLADLADQMLPELRRADPGAKVVGRVEAGVHVGEVVLGRIADPGRLGQQLRVAAGRAAVLA